MGCLQKVDAVRWLVAGADTAHAALAGPVRTSPGDDPRLRGQLLHNTIKEQGGRSRSLLAGTTICTIQYDMVSEKLAGFGIERQCILAWDVYPIVGGSVIEYVSYRPLT